MKRLILVTIIFLAGCQALFPEVVWHGPIEKLEIGMTKAQAMEVFGKDIMYSDSHVTATMVLQTLHYGPPSNPIALTFCNGKLMVISR